MDPVMIRGSMERVHEKGSMDPVYIFMDPAHVLVHDGGPGVHVLYFPAHTELVELHRFQRWLPFRAKTINTMCKLGHTTEVLHRIHPFSLSRTFVTERWSVLL